jgi:hypothetical protein
MTIAITPAALHASLMLVAQALGEAAVGVVPGVVSLHGRRAAGSE